MPSLRDTQERFTQALFSGDDAGIEAMVLGGTLPTAQRLDIYRNNVLVNYRNALRDTYPAIVRLVGDEFFNAAAWRYARTHHSGSGDLHDYGDTFAEFLGNFEPASTLPYLPDMARLEWAMHRVFHAADAPALTAADFAGMDENRLPSLCLALHPATWLLTSRYPLTRIWRISQPGAEADDVQVDLDEGAQCLLLIRRDHEVHIEQISPAEHAMLEAMNEGGTLGAAVDAALRHDPAFDLGAALLRHVAGGSFLSHKE